MINRTGPMLPRSQRWGLRLSAYGCEWLGTALIMFNALAWACWNFGANSPFMEWVPDRGIRVIWQAICAAGGTAIVIYSPLGKRAGGHLNPSLTVGFWVLRKIAPRDAVVYIIMQLLGAFSGALLVWILFPSLVRSIRGGATVLRQGISPAIGFGLELAMTFGLMLVILVLVNSRWMRWTGVAASVVFVLLYVNAVQWTGASLNPARSLAPATIIWFWQHQWIYWVAPPLGASLAALLYRQGAIGTGKSYCCKLYHTHAIPCHHYRCGYRHPANVDDFARPMMP